MGKSKKRKKPSRNPQRNGHPSGPQGHEHDHESAVWIRTEPTIDGTGWMVTMELDADHTLALDRAAAMECAYVILGAAAYAEYDASVLRQMRTRVKDEKSAMQLVVDLRKDRPDLDWTLMAPFSLVPGVNSKAEPFLTVHMKGEPVGQWSLPDARTHALTILEALVVADLDAAYLRCLKGVVGLEDSTARNVVGDLQDFRP